MKRLYLAALTVCTAGAFQAQSLSEDFDSYTPGDYMGVVSDDWTTWSGAVGGAEDVQVTDNNSASGNNSIYFSSTSANGGPQDVVVPFGGTYTSGTFVLEANFMVEENRGAYFNFQALPTIGQIWSMNVYMIQNGDIIMDDGANVIAQGAYPNGEWFNLRIVADLSLNKWELFVDDVSLGFGPNSVNQIASIDLFPVNNSYGGNGSSGFYIDDFSYEYTPFVLPELNGAVIGITGINGLATQVVTPSIRVKNLGETDISSFDLSLSYQGEEITMSVPDLVLQSYAFYDVELNDDIMLAAGESVISATISNVNGEEQDDIEEDDTLELTINPLVPAPGKVVVGEEGTGTWCQWCPRGAVFMDYMEETYGEFWEGIAVHNGDPMVYQAYDLGLQGIISGYPSSVVDRGSDIDPSAMEPDFLERIITPPAAVITPGAAYNEETGMLDVSLSMVFAEATDMDDYRFAVVLTEDGVTGTGTGYNQVNAYAGGGNGPMGGYESLPNPVPAAQMVYDHVARIIAPSFGGAQFQFVESVSAGETVVVNAQLEIGDGWDTNNMHVIGLLIDSSTNRIDNAGSATYDEALENGFILGENDIEELSSFNLYPNPSNGSSQISLGETKGRDVIVRVYSTDGRLVASRNYGRIGDNQIIPVEAGSWSSGIYVVEVQVGNDMTHQRLVIE